MIKMLEENRQQQIKKHWLPIDKTCLLLGFCEGMCETFFNEVSEGLKTRRLKRPYKELIFYPQIHAYFPTIYNHFILLRDIYIKNINFKTKNELENIFYEITETRNAFSHPVGDDYQSIIPERNGNGTDFYIKLNRVKGKSFKRLIISYKNQGDYFCIKEDLALMKEFYSILYQEKQGKEPSYKYKYKSLFKQPPPRPRI